MRERLSILIARVRSPLLYAALIVTITSLWQDVAAPAIAGAIVLVVLVGSMYLPYGQLRREPRVVRAPVLGRWIAVNSPADRVPSHGVHTHGQSYAVDLVHQPADRGTWKAVHAWPPARPPRWFAGFGQPVYSVADGVVVKAAGRQRDHWSRNSWLGVIWQFAEGAIRDMVGPRFLLGNHIVVDLGDGAYAVYAHLRRGSIRVTPGQRVAAGEQLAECGNSGNTSEPHLHFQLMDHRSSLVAAGLPVAFDRYEIDGEVRTGVPGGLQAFITSRPSRTPASSWRP